MTVEEVMASASSSLGGWDVHRVAVRRAPGSRSADAALINGELK